MLVAGGRNERWHEAADRPQSTTQAAGRRNERQREAADRLRSTTQAAGGQNEMLKRERSDLDFVEIGSIFVPAKEEAAHSKRLPPFLAPL